MSTPIEVLHQSYTQPRSAHPSFKPGDTVCVHLKIQERNKERIQKFEGTVIKDKGQTIADKTFTVRKISNGVPVWRIFPIELPAIQKIEVIRRGLVRRANLSYLRGKIGQAAKIKHKKFIGKKSMKKNKPDTQKAQTNQPEAQAPKQAKA
ncbi:MAG: 50S ribosomal protein L19 [Bacteroidota bacterium]